MFAATRSNRATSILLQIFSFLIFSTGFLFAQTPFKIEISDINNIVRGSNISVPVIKMAGTEEMHSFEFSFSYDITGMKFLDATPGPIFGSSGAYQWEHFEARIDSITYPVYDSLYPPRMGYFIRASAISDLNNGSHHPMELHIPDGTVLFYLNFHVTYNISFTCNAIPVRFFWVDCEDNFMKYGSAGDTGIAVSKDIFDWNDYIVTDPFANLPSYQGMPNSCLDSSIFGGLFPVRSIDYYHGFMNIACDSANPLRGDINLNGLPYEIADAVNFADYFIQGKTAFNISLDSQINAGDINGDLAPAQIEDYIYLSGIISGEMSPNQTITDGSFGLLKFDEIGSILKVSGNFGVPMGGLQLCYYATNSSPYNVILLPHASQMDLNYSKSGDTLRILIHSDMALGGIRDSIPSGFGELFQITYSGNGPRLVSAQASGFYAQKVTLSWPSPYDSRGDLNLNGIADEIADGIVYANYFLYGLDALRINQPLQIATSDINNDGLVLTLEDYVYLLGVIKGFFIPIPNPKPGKAFGGSIALTRIDSSYIISTKFDDSLGALHLCFFAPDLQSNDDLRIKVHAGADSMDIACNVDGGVLRVLISKLSSMDSSMVVIGPDSMELFEIIYAGDRFGLASALAASSNTQGIYTGGFTFSHDYPPVFAEYPTTLTNDYLGEFVGYFRATDPNFKYPPEKITCSIISGPGSFIEPISGPWDATWVYAPICKSIGESYTLTVCASESSNPCPQADTTLHATVQLSITNQPPLVGDVDNSGGLNMLDITYLINFLYRHGSEPIPIAIVGDLNGNGVVNILDITYMINHLFKNGPAPICP